MTTLTIEQYATLLSRDLRNNMTRGELIFWQKVRNKQFMGYKFLRQHPIFYEYNRRKKFFIADFYCRNLGIIIEIDGGIHESQKEYDRNRSEILKSQRELNVLRFTNEEVIENVNKVLITLKNSF